MYVDQSEGEFLFVVALHGAMVESIEIVHVSGSYSILFSLGFEQKVLKQMKRVS